MSLDLIFILIGVLIDAATLTVAHLTWRAFLCQKEQREYCPYRCTH
jgi:hypothetical protein